jgi:hypothetical protein
MNHSGERGKRVKYGCGVRDILTCELFNAGRSPRGPIVWYVAYAPSAIFRISAKRSLDSTVERWSHGIIKCNNEGKVQMPFVAKFTAEISESPK